ncbi:hypothetical protein CERZMDRAFT_68288 [Cercospora zeae-maydis SCOH1-5]|uniref:Uncharacterized protein n=1 Tax=Cercospora zeae-maydis SCOH1-5 TaxID=717836 RepID=A0A6A6FF72_9PEZI|nr:hypothetical protein CERZMDRAFT_68288 [Cercospora zeae-maydis SCOH1-5]
MMDERAERERGCHDLPCKSFEKKKERMRDFTLPWMRPTSQADSMWISNGLRNGNAAKSESCKAGTTAMIRQNEFGPWQNRTERKSDE